jgi:CRP/FNR family transcriptional regulator
LLQTVTNGFHLSPFSGFRDIVAFQGSGMIVLEPAFRRNHRGRTMSSIDFKAFENTSSVKPSVLAGLGSEHPGASPSNVTVEAKQMVFYEGDPADYVYEVVSGTVKLYKLLADGRRQITGFFFPGDLIGVGLHDTHTHSAEAVIATQLRKYSRSRLQAAMNQNPVISRQMFGLAADELAAAQDQLLLLGRKSPIEKVASFLLKLSERNCDRGEAPSPIYLPMARSDIADYLGLTTETVSRTFSRLRRERAIRLLESHLVELVDMDRLECYADGSESEYGDDYMHRAA